MRFKYFEMVFSRLFEMWILGFWSRGENIVGCDWVRNVGSFYMNSEFIFYNEV